jgi:hypothetical protein
MACCVEFPSLMTLFYFLFIHFRSQHVFQLFLKSATASKVASDNEGLPLPYQYHPSNSLFVSLFLPKQRLFLILCNSPCLGGKKETNNGLGR